MLPSSKDAVGVSKHCRVNGSGCTAACKSYESGRVPSKWSGCSRPRVSKLRLLVLLLLPIYVLLE